MGASGPRTGTFASSQYEYVSTRFPTTKMRKNAARSAARRPNVSASARSPAASPPGTIAMSVLDLARTSATMGLDATSPRVWGVSAGALLPISGLVPTVIFVGMNVMQTMPGCRARSHGYKCVTTYVG